MISPEGGSPPSRSGWLAAGLQAGMGAVLVLQAWLGVSAVWQRRSFWTSANLMASLFYGEDSIHAGFARPTVAGLALYIVVYGTLGALFAVVVGGRARGLNGMMLGMALGMGWYFVCFHALLRRVGPLVVLLHSERPTLLGHMLYGVALARFTALLQPDGEK